VLYARIKLADTDYTVMPNSAIIDNPDPDELEHIYNTYCVYKQFKSVTPIFVEEYLDEKNDVIGYYDQEKLVAFSLIRRYNSKNIEAVQFAWDYANPKLHLGIASLRSECALYKQLGFDYLYLGEANDYKKKINGFEILGPRT
jgi:arginyl-tRNA--protein-N-Asp/Glu arginylyltransferase